MTTFEESIFIEWDVGIQEEVFECNSNIVSNAINNIGKPPIYSQNYLGNSAKDARVQNGTSMSCKAMRESTCTCISVICQECC